MNYRIEVRHTSIYIYNYNLGDCESLEKYLSVWNPTYFRYDSKGFMYDDNKKILMIPRGVDINYIEKLLNSTSETNYTPDEHNKVSIKLKVMPRDDIQKKSISFLIGETDFKYSKKYAQLLLNLQPGDGKTYISTAALTFLGMSTIVITHIDRIKQQWYDTFTNMTDLQESHIYSIDSSKAIDKLLGKSNLKYKVYLVNHGTLQSYAKSNGWESVGELFRHLKIGVKIFDEAHLNFENIVKIDLNTNTKKTIYLTATFERSDYKENRLFNICFRNVIRYGSETRKEKRKHIMYLAVLYNSKPSIDKQTYMNTYHGFNKIRYSDYQIECQEFYDALKYTVNYFKDKDGKIMIMSSKIDSTEIIKDFINDNFPNLSVSTYHSKLSSDEKEKALSADIISTTPKSSGTGVDIPGLRTVIMAESYSSTVQADQVSGRLREFSDHDNTFYVELVDVGFTKVYSMYKKRLPLFKKKCAKVLTLQL